MSSAAILIITDLLVKPLHSQCRCHYLKDTNIEACFILAYSHFNLEFFEIPWDSYKMGFCREGDFVVARYLNCFPFSLNGSGRHGIYPICILLAALFSRPKVIIVPKVILYIVYFLFFSKIFLSKMISTKLPRKWLLFTGLCRKSFGCIWTKDLWIGK